MAIATEVIDGIPLCSICAQFVRATEEYWCAPEPYEYGRRAICRPPKPNAHG